MRLAGTSQNETSWHTHCVSESVGLSLELSEEIVHQEIRHLDLSVLKTDRLEVISFGDGQSLAVGHVKDISTGGLSLEPPEYLRPRAREDVQDDVQRTAWHTHRSSGASSTAESLGFGCTEASLQPAAFA